MKIQSNKNIRTAIILCGGRGTRLGLITKKIPKSLVKIKGKPIIWYILKMLKKNNFNHFILPTGYKADLLEKYLRKDIFKSFNLSIVNTGINTSIAKRISSVKKFIKSEDFLLLNGDAIFNFKLDKIFENHLKNKNTHITFLGSEVILPYGTIVVSKSIVKNFQRDVIFNAVKIKDKNNSIAHVYSGMAILKKKLLSHNFSKYKNFEEDLYPRIIKKYKCKFQKLSGFWHSIDNIKDINVLNTDSEKRKKIKIILKDLNR